MWLADVLFKGTRQTKQRPVVIGNQFDIILEYWEKAGLLKPSVVRKSKITSIHGTELKRHLADLYSHDLENVLNMCRKLFYCLVIRSANVPDDRTRKNGNVE